MQGSKDRDVGEDAPLSLSIKPEIMDDNSCDAKSPAPVSTVNDSDQNPTPITSVSDMIYPPVTFSPYLTSPVAEYTGQIYPNTLMTSKPTQSPNPYPSPSDRKPLVFRPSEYKKSERGLSYLFPSLADQQLSLLDKVKVTVMRHKNNYFLNWGEEELKKIDPIVRPKMIVTKDLYKEYCHRNAMKYDSNLQFCMESPEAWAQDFRDRLAKPPSEGGFHSLCEVKQEAGRLWKEHSGRYKMHNVVKAQMDMNNEAAKHIRSEIKVKKRHRGHYEVPEERQSPSSPHSSPGSVSSLQRPLSRYSPAGVMGMLPYTPHSSPYDSMTDVSVENSHKRRRLDDSCSSAASSPQILEEHRDVAGKCQHLYSPSDEGSVYMPALPITLSLPPAEDIMLAAPDSDSLFQPLPLTLSVSQQIAVWMERHRNNYYLAVPPEAIQHLHPLLKPHFVVNDAVYQRFLSKDMVTMFDHVYRILSSSQDWAIQYQDRLSKDVMDGGFSSLEEALAEAVDLWNRFLSEEKTSQVCSKCHLINCNCFKSMQQWTGVGEKGSSPIISSPATQDGSVQAVVLGGLQGFPTSTPNLSQSDLSNHEVLDLSIPSSSSSSLSNGASLQGTSTTTSSGGSGGNGSPAWTQALIWSSRERLRDALREDPTCSWHTRLQPHMATLRQNLRPDYACPSDVADCRVDLVLAVLQQHFTMAAQQ